MPNNSSNQPMQQLRLISKIALVLAILGLLGLVVLFFLMGNSKIVCNTPSGETTFYVGQKGLCEALNKLGVQNDASRPRVSLDGDRLTINDTTVVIPRDTNSSNDIVGPIGPMGLAGSAGAVGAQGTPGTPAPPGGGTLNQAYNFGGPGVGRAINLTPGSPVQIYTPVVAGGPIEYTAGFAVTGDGDLNNPDISGVSFAKMVGDFGGGVTDGSATVYSADIRSITAGTYGFNAFMNYPGNEIYVNGLNNGMGYSYGQVAFATWGTSLSAGDSLVSSGNGLQLDIRAGDGGSASGDGGKINIHSGDASTDGDGGGIYMGTGQGLGMFGMGGDIHVDTGHGELNGGNINFDTGNGTSNDGGHIGFLTGDGLNRGGAVSIGTGSGTNIYGGTLQLSTGNSINGSGGDILFSTGTGGVANGSIQFYIGNSERGRFDSSGQLLVNTSSPIAGKVAVFGGDMQINGIDLGLGGGAIATNTALGFNSLGANTTGPWNTAVGYSALANNTTADRNTAVGWNALSTVTTGGSNTAVGGFAMSSATNGYQNSALGRGALQSLTWGYNNTAVGALALPSLQGGVNNVAMGNAALNVANGGNQNVAIGVMASITQTTASTNTIIGYNTGGGITTGSRNTILGANVNGLSPTLTNTVIIADGSGARRLYIDSTGNTGIGTSAPGTFRLNVTNATTTNVAQFNGSGATQCTVVTGTGWSCTSDESLKTNILSITNGIDIINQLQGVTYNWKDDLEGSRQNGFIAQDIQKVLPELVTTDDNGNLSLNKDGIMPYIVEAVKSQNGNIEGVNSQLKDQGLQISLLSDELKALSIRVQQNSIDIEHHNDEIEQLKAKNQLLEQRLEKLESR